MTNKTCFLGIHNELGNGSALENVCSGGSQY